MTNPAALSAGALLPARKSVLADRFVTRSIATDAALIAGGVAVMGVLAQVVVPLWPVPVTGQTLGVLLVGATLGARRGALSLLAYALVGLVGLPIFAEHNGGFASVMLPSFGFIVGFIPAAFAIGWLSERQWDRHVVRSLVGFFLASLIPFAVGLPFLGFALARLGYPHDVSAVLAAGFTPFIVGGIVKWVIAAGMLPLLWRGVRALDSKKND
ncbi:MULTISPECIES: biotin transporter BioY [unclassified Frondihabitans]|jgi:biotin transport system substrate-specific component|uniref:biotin transporter BioY n=1 Tax=unclassified Frondihabitans TaxID=2626248 RepID=UPI0006F64A15|nr:MULTISPECIES: biotin transporter BioY [unclassified Frondihabitans]KQQ27443.1 BioY protein [Frondihabitans sp. Leaf304]MBF4577450.1 biotin transporter BioY [Frondihabitans sp. VKM Ac-2883]